MSGYNFRVKQIILICCLISVMSATKKIAVGLGLFGGAFLATWLLSGDRRARKTRDYIVKKASDLREAVKREKSKMEDNDVHYV